MAATLYTDVGTLKGRLEIANSDHDADLQSYITAASRAIDRWCHRPDNGFVGQTETRVYDVPGKLTGPIQFTRDMTLASDIASGMSWASSVNVIEVGALLSATQVSTDPDMDGVFETVWSAATDYDLLPINAALDGRPYRQIRALPNGNQVFPIGVRTLQVSGVWGEYLTVPALIQEATLIVAARWWKRRETPFGVMLDAATGGPGMRLPAQDPDVRLMLCEAGFERSWKVV